MSRKDFSRKTNAFAPVLVNDSYANFRFSKRAGEVLSPLNRSKFGFNKTANVRKMTLNPSKYRTEMKNHRGYDAANRTVDVIN